MSAPHAGMQLQSRIELDLIRSKLQDIFREIISMHNAILEMYDQLSPEEISPEAYLEEFENEMKQIMADQNNKHHSFKDMLSGQQIIEEEIRVKKEIDNKLYEEASEVIVLVDGQSSNPRDNQ